MTKRTACETIKVEVIADGGRLVGFVHIDRNAETGAVEAVRIVPSRKIGSLLHAWLAEVSDSITDMINAEAS